LDVLRDPDDTPRRFLEYWYGPPSRPAGPIPGGDLPLTVREFVALVARWPRVIVQNELVNDPPRWRDGDKRVFYEENQAVYLWATDGVGADPIVFGRFDGGPWKAEREPLSRFLVQVLLHEAVFASPFGAFSNAVPAARLPTVLGPMERLLLAPWRWPSDPTWFHGADDLVAMVTPAAGVGDEGADGPVFVFYGARSEAALGVFDDVPEVERRG
jgi:hypothetical protein